MKLRHVFFFSLVFLLGMAFVGPRAEAQSPDPTGQQLADRAKRDHDLGRLAEAIDGYTRAYQVSGDLELLFNLAKAHREAGHNADALKIFQSYLRRDPQSPQHRENAEKQVKELEKLPAVVVPPRPAPIATKPAPLLAPPPPSSPPPTPLSPPPLSPPPLAPPPLSPPPPPVLDAPVPIAPQSDPGATVDLTAAATPPQAVPGDGLPLPRWLPWTLAATTVALGTGAIISGLSASHRYNQLHDSCGQTADGCPGDQIDDMKSRALRTNVLWALTGLAAVGTGVTVYVNAHAAGVAGLWRF